MGGGRLRLLRPALVFWSCPVGWGVGGAFAFALGVRWCGCPGSFAFAFSILRWCGCICIAACGGEAVLCGHVPCCLNRLCLFREGGLCCRLRVCSGGCGWGVVTLARLLQFRLASAVGYCVGSVRLLASRERRRMPRPGRVS